MPLRSAAGGGGGAGAGAAGAAEGEVPSEEQLSAVDERLRVSDFTKAPQ
jgi:hypothetical protein